MDTRNIIAKLNLAVSFWIHIVKRIVALVLRTDYLKRFRRQYAPDHIFALTAAERTNFPAFSRCIGCGLCTAACAIEKKPSGVLAADYFVVSSSRDLPNLFHHRNVELCNDCRACDEVCPSGVDISGLVAFIRSKQSIVSP